MREWIMRLLAVGRRGRRDEQLDDELRFHIGQLAGDFERRGLDPAAARAAAERELGGVDRTKQAWRDQRSWLPTSATGRCAFFNNSTARSMYSGSPPCAASVR